MNKSAVFSDVNKIKSESGYIFSKSISIPNLQIEDFKKYISYNISSNSILYVGESYYINFDNVKESTPDDILDFYKSASDFMVSKGIIPAGIRNCKPKDKKYFNDSGIAVYIENPQEAKKTIRKDVQSNESSEMLSKSISNSKTVIFRGLLRGGNQLKNENGDIVIIGSVNMGAEVYASGNIIVIGSAEGKLIAGVNDPEAFIYAKLFKTTIVSINGNYKTIENNSVLYGSEDMLVELKDEDLSFKLMGVWNGWLWFGWNGLPSLQRWYIRRGFHTKVKC